MQCLNDGPGIANYLNGCRERFRSHIVQRAIAKRTKEGSDSDSFNMTAKSKSTELGVKTVARLNTAIHAEDAEAGDVHYHTSWYTKHNNDARTAKSKSSHAKRGSPVGCSYDPVGNRSACRVCGVQSFNRQAC